MCIIAVHGNAILAHFNSQQQLSKVPSIILHGYIVATKMLSCCGTRIIYILIAETLYEGYSFPIFDA